MNIKSVTVGLARTLLMQKNKNQFLTEKVQPQKSQICQLTVAERDRDAVWLRMHMNTILHYSWLL